MALVPFPSKAAKSAAERDPDRLGRRRLAADDGGKMSFLDHLDELRRRIIWALVGVVVGFGDRHRLLSAVCRLRDASRCRRCCRPGQTLIYTEPTEALMLYLKIARHRRHPDRVAARHDAGVAVRRARPLLAREEAGDPVRSGVVVFFIGGAAFAHYYVFPLTFKFFGSFSSDVADVHAAHRAGVLALHEAGADLRRSSSRCRRWCCSWRGWG